MIWRYDLDHEMEFVEMEEIQLSVDKSIVHKLSTTGVEQFFSKNLLTFYDR